MATLIERLEALIAQPKGQGEGHVYVTPDEEVWECGRCGFTFLVDHVDEGTDGHSCPLCFEDTVRPLLPALLRLAKAVKARQDYEGAPTSTWVMAEASRLRREVEAALAALNEEVA